MTIERNSPEDLANYENLRSQLKSGNASKPSFLSLVGIFKIQTGSGDIYGVGVHTAKNILLTLKKYVSNGNGSVFLRRSNYEGKTLDFNINDTSKFEKFTIRQISLSDSDFATI